MTRRRVSSRLLTGACSLELAASGDVLPELRSLVSDEDIRFSPNGELLAVATDRGIAVWNVADATEKVRLARIEYRVQALAWNPDGTEIAAVLTDGYARTWSATTGEVVGRPDDFADLLPPELFGTEVTAVGYRPDGDLYTGGTGGEVRRWITGAGERAQAIGGLLNGPASVNSLTVSPDGSMLAAAYPALVGLWNTEAVDRIQVAEPGTEQVDASVEQRQLREQDDINILDVAFSSDSRLLATAGNRGSVTIWDARTGQRLQSLAGHLSSVRSVRFFPDGRTVMTAGDDGTVRLHLIDVPALIELAQSQLTRQFTEQECTRFGLESARCPSPDEG